MRPSAKNNNKLIEKQWFLIYEVRSLDMGESAVKQLRVSKVGVCWIMKGQDPCGYIRVLYTMI